MSASSIRIVDETTIFTTVAYDRVFAIAKEAAIGLGGQLKAEDINAGRLQFKFRYGINPTGIRVTVQFRRSADESTEMVVTGGVGDSFDVTGQGKARGRAVLNEIVRRIESGETSQDSVAPGEYQGGRAPIMGTVGAAHRGKSKTVSVLLALILGGLGAHRFYLGSWGFGLVYLLLSLIGLGVGFPIGACAGLYDAIRFLVMKGPSFDAKFNYAEVRPFTF